MSFRQRKKSKQNYIFLKKFTQKLYNYDTLNEFENQISAIIIFVKHLDFFNQKPQILRIVNMVTLACSFFFSDQFEIYVDALLQ